jgi:hypothetical protein
VRIPQREEETPQAVVALVAVILIFPFLFHMRDSHSTGVKSPRKHFPGYKHPCGIALGCIEQLIRESELSSYSSIVPSKSSHDPIGKVTMILSSRGLKNINFDEKTFVFNVNGERFQVSKFAAQFISPAISRSLRTDLTVTEFSIGTPSAKECFHHFLSLCEGDSIIVEKSMIWRFAAVCRELENDELLSIIVTNEPISSDNITDCLLTVGADSDFEFACSHFCLLNHSLLSVDILERLLDDP